MVNLFQDKTKTNMNNQNKLLLVIILSVLFGIVFTQQNGQDLTYIFFYTAVPIVLSLIMASIQELFLKLFKKNYSLTKTSIFKAFFGYWIVWIIICGLSTLSYLMN